ncbi:hypothetical protein Bca101_055109 [Brassica carinata]
MEQQEWSLISHKAPFLESLYLSIDDTTGPSDIEILIGVAFSRHVRKLALCHLRRDPEDAFRFPSMLCSYNNTLHTLKLMHDVHLEFPSPVCLNALRELHLHDVIFTDEASVTNLFSGCPRLQDLFVTRIMNYDVVTYTIAVPSLQRLTIEEDHFGGGSDDGGYVINAPSLKYLNMDCIVSGDFCLMENAPELVEAKIFDVPHMENENILASLTSAKRLSLDLPLTIKYPIFYQLVSLELLVNELNVGNLWLMLDNSPKLQNLKLISPKRVPECLLDHLETLVWTEYEWEREDEKQVATYILQNARRLKKATLLLEELEKRSNILNELASVVRASTSCDLVLE